MIHQLELTTTQKRRLENLFRGVRHTLLNRGLYRRLKDGSIQEVAWKRTILLNDLGVVAFEVDTLRLPVKIEHLLDPDVAHQMEATLGGRRVWMANSSSLAFCVSLEQKAPTAVARLPRRVSLDLDARPGGAYLIPVGQGQEGPVWRSLLDTGHVLVGGETGSGKSTWLNAMLVALLASHTPQQLQVAIVDPKQVEFQTYSGVPHLFDDLVVEVGQAGALLARVLLEVDRRMALFTRAGAKSLASYNDKVGEPLPLILLLVDEVTDVALQAGLKSEFYKDLIRLASKGRAFGLVLVLATQNPKAEVLNTLIRGNMSTRIAFRVTTVDHSRVILGEGGAQTLPRTIRGRLLTRIDGELKVLQGFYVSDDEITTLVAGLCDRPVPVLSELEQSMVRYAVKQLDGEFNTNVLWPAFRDRIGRDALLALARRWEQWGWLAGQPGVNVPRQVTDELIDLIAGRNRR